MKTFLKIAGVFLCLLYLLSAALPSPTLAADTVKMGMIFSLTGPGAPVGKLQEQGAKLAVSEINDAGGVDIGGQKLKLEAVIKDDQTKPPAAVKAMQDMVKQQGVKSVIGGTFAHIGLALNNEAKENKAFFIATSGVPDVFFKKDVKAPNAMGMVGGAEDMSRPSVKYVLQDMRAQKIACFVPAYALGQSAVAAFEAEVKKYPGVKHEVFWHPVGGTDLKRDLTKVAEFKPEVLFIASWGQDAINALDQVNKMGLNKNMAVVYFWLTDAYATNVPPEAMKGLNSAMWWFHDMTGFKDDAVVKASDEFTAKYMKAYDIPPDPYALASYYSVKETARAMELAKATDPDKMYAALMANPEWQSVKGPAKWRKDGRPEFKYFAWIVQGKGPDERKNSKYGSSSDFAQIINVVSGENLLPKLQDIGY